MPGYRLGSFIVLIGIIQHVQRIVLFANQFILVNSIFEKSLILIICSKFSVLESVEWHFKEDLWNVKNFVGYL